MRTPRLSRAIAVTLCIQLIIVAFLIPPSAIAAEAVKVPGRVIFVRYITRSLSQIRSLVRKGVAAIARSVESGTEKSAPPSGASRVGSALVAVAGGQGGAPPAPQAPPEPEAPPVPEPPAPEEPLAPDPPPPEPHAPITPTPADPLAWGLPASLTANGTSTVVFGHNTRYEASPGVWDDIDLTFRASGPDHIVEKNHLRSRVSVSGIEVEDPVTGKGIRWRTPAGKPTVSGKKATFSDQGLIWEYETTPQGLKASATVSATRGPQTYTFHYTQLGGSADFAVDEVGNLMNGTFIVPRAFATGADGRRYEAGAWQILPGQRVAFDFDDTGIPLPYELDPTTVKASSGDGGLSGQTKRVHRVSNGNIVVFYFDSGIKHAVSSDGASWTVAPSVITGTFPFLILQTDIDSSDNIHAVYLIYESERYYFKYNRATPNAGRTQWTWETATTIVDTGASSTFGAAITVHSEGTGWAAHLVTGYVLGGPRTMLEYYKVDITSGGGRTLSGATTFINSLGNSYNTRPSIRHNSSKTLLLVYQADWYSPAQLIGKAATYSGGSWSWGSDETGWVTSPPAGANIAADSSNRFIIASREKVFRRAAASASYTDISPSLSLPYGSSDIVSKGDDLYLAWVYSNGSTWETRWRKYTNSTSSWGSDTTIESTSLQIYNGSTTNRSIQYLMDFVYVTYNSGTSSYDTKHAYVNLNTTPSAPTWTDPAASDTLVGTETLAATTTDADGDNWYATFEVHSDSGYTALVRTITGSTVASGGSSTNTWDTTLDANGTYYLRAKATDAGAAVSGWTNLGSVTVANTKGYQMML